MKFTKLIGATTVAFLLTAGVAGAQTYGTSGNTGSTNSSNPTGTDTTGTVLGTSTTPGTPNTGAGGDAAMNLSLLGSSALLALLGSGYLARRRG